MLQDIDSFTMQELCGGDGGVHHHGIPRKRVRLSIQLLVLCTRWWLKSPILEWHALPQAGQM